MLRVLKWSVVFLVALALAAGAGAQQRNFHPEKYERATVKDDAGRVQWAEHQELQCPNCKGTGKVKCTTCERYPEEATKCPDCNRAESREAVCHACAGTGKFPDPLEHVLCPGCLGGGYMLCTSCPGSGILLLGDGAKRWSNCISCRGDGWAKCMICDGTRLAEPAKLKPSLKEADAKTLRQALEATEKSLQAVSAFTPTAKNSRKEIKDLLAAIKIAEKVYPPMKEMPKLAKELMGWAYAGSQYQGQAEREAQAMQRIKNGAEYYLQHQRRMVTLALQRAEANEQIDGGK